MVSKRPTIAVWFGGTAILAASSLSIKAALARRTARSEYGHRLVPHPSGFVAPCLASKVTKPPIGSLWVHEIKHDGYRLMVRRDGGRVRGNGNDWADRFPAIVET